MDTKNSPQPLQLLKQRLSTISDLQAAGALMSWDQQTYMPEDSVSLRSEQLATISRLSHEMFVADETGELLASIDGELDPESEDFALVRLARREYERAAKLPARLVAEIARVTSLAEPAWTRARAEADWTSFAPHLERIIELQRESADHLGYKNHPYDALLDLYEPGAKKAAVERMFEELKRGIVPLLDKIDPDEDRSDPLRGRFDVAKQQGFGRTVISSLGYDWSRGRQDEVAHPFCTSIGGPQDVRITTRFHPERVDRALFTLMHEAGHAMYEQGINPKYARSPLSSGTSMGIHESQSRLWENLVGRSREFWSHYYPLLQNTFPEALGDVDLEAFYRAVNEVRPGLIRVDSDELTYNLHVLLRFELELSLMEGELSVKEIPSVWNAKMEEYLGISPQNAAEGPLQDIHWSAGLFGYFPTYSMGNVLSVQFYTAALESHPEIPYEVGQGKFDTLRSWLTENIYRHGGRHTPEELVERVTGRPLDTAPYLDYLRGKFGELY